MKESVLNTLRRVKEASRSLSTMSEAARDNLLLQLADTIRKSSEKLLIENAKDLALMDMSSPKYDRLALSKDRIDSIANDVERVASLHHPKHRVINETRMPNGLRIQKVSVPLGVVAVIYESRPNVTIDVFGLCFKSGNACILKGGKEAYYSNQCFASMIQQTLHAHAIDQHVVYLLQPDREAMDILLTATHLVDVCIPRGGSALINYVREHAKIPVIETGAGIVHTYFDASGDSEKGRCIIHNAKTRRVSVCNALDTLIIHEARLLDLPGLVAPLADHPVEIYADQHSYAALYRSYPQDSLHKASPTDFGQEYLDYKMSIKTVSSIEASVKHITEYTSGHSEAIIAEDPEAITYFLNSIDAAALYVNASTAFTDGGQFGMGAEIGISTQKLHARGPMALDALTSYQWIVYGDGQIRE